MASKSFFDEGKRANAFDFDPEKIQLITDPKDPRYDPRVELPVNAGLVASIKRRGVLEPVIVAREGGRPVVIDGRQRVKAARQANNELRAEHKVPHLVRCVPLVPKSDADAYGIHIAANEHRTDDSVLVKAEKARVMVSELHIPKEDVCVDFGIAKSTLENWLSLFEVGADVRKAVESGKIPPSAAYKLSKLDRPDQKEQLEALLQEGNGRPTVAKVQRGVAAKNGSSAGLPPRKALRAWIDTVKENDDRDVAIIRSTVGFVIGTVQFADLPKAVRDVLPKDLVSA